MLRRMIYNMQANMLILERKNDFIWKNRLFSCLFGQWGLRVVFILLWRFLRGCICILSLNLSWKYCLQCSSITGDLCWISWQNFCLGCSWHESAATSLPTAIIPFHSVFRTAWMSVIIWSNSSSSVLDRKEKMEGIMYLTQLS